MVPTEVLERYAIDGYFIADDVVDPDMLARLREAAPRVKARARSGEVYLYNNVAAPNDPWVIDGILTSAFSEPVFAEYMVSDRLLRYAHTFCGPDIRLGYLGMLTNPYNVDFDLYWHRDVMKLSPDDFPDVSATPPATRARQTRKLRWTTALVPDANLRLVPGSHARWGTELENRNMTEHLSEDLPGQRLIELEPGQTVFYDERILHRALTRKERDRFGLFGTWARYIPGEPKLNPIPEMRWMLRPGIRDTFPESLRLYYDRFCEVYQSVAPASPLISHAEHS
jgi:Phytanoyl-CoA dioxygenase (PhyH)